MFRIVPPAALAVLVACSTCSASTITIQLFDSYGSTGGGEFRAHIMTPNVTAGRTGTAFQGSSTGTNFIAAASNRFETFCVERHEFISVGGVTQLTTSSQYTAVINTKTAGGASAYLSGGFGGANDSLDPMTAYLYTAFIKNSWAAGVNFNNGYNYNSAQDAPGQTARTTSADALQRAIWFIEHEFASSAFPTGNYSNTNASHAQAILGANSAAYKYWLEAYNAGWTTIGNVRILNLYNSSGGRHQDQLIMIPLPAGSGMAGAGLACLFGIGYFQRRRRHG